jgi:transposase
LVLTGTQDQEEIVEPVEALDIGKAELTCCVRVQDEDRPGKRLQEVEAYSTMTPARGWACPITCAAWG